MSDEILDLIESPAPTATRCAQCGGSLPQQRGTFAAVSTLDDSLLVTCSAGCLAILVADLVGCPSAPAVREDL